MPSSKKSLHKSIKRQIYDTELVRGIFFMEVWHAMWTVWYGLLWHIQSILWSMIESKKQFNHTEALFNRKRRLWQLGADHYNPFSPPAHTLLACWDPVCRQLLLEDLFWTPLAATSMKYTTYSFVAYLWHWLFTGEHNQDTAVYIHYLQEKSFYFYTFC